MEDALLKLVITAPAAAAVIFTVWLFLKAQRSHQEDHNKLTKELNERSTKCHEECTEAVKENRSAVAENTVVLTRVSTLLETRIRQIDGEEG